MSPFFTFSQALPIVEPLSLQDSPPKLFRVIYCYAPPCAMANSPNLGENQALVLLGKL